MAQGRIRIPSIMLIVSTIVSISACSMPAEDYQLSDYQSGTYVGKVSAVEANVWRNGSGEVVSDMGPTAHLACHDSYFKERYSKQGFYYIAPSDPILNEWLGRGECGPNPNGGEPACEQYRDVCGAIVAIRLREGVGTENLASRVLSAQVNNAMGYPGKDSEYKDLAWQSREFADEKKDVVPTVIYAVINDFCPKLHSVNKASNNCAGKQADLGPGVWFSGIPGYKVNPQGWLDTQGLALDMSLVKDNNGNIKKANGNEWMLGPKSELK